MSEQLSEKQKADKRARDKELSDLRFVLGSPEGRRVLWRIMSKAYMFHDPYVIGDGGFGTHINVGMQRVGRFVLNEIIEAKPESYLKMQNEHASALKSKEVEQKLKDEHRDILQPSV